MRVSDSVPDPRRRGAVGETRRDVLAPLRALSLSLLLPLALSACFETTPLQPTEQVSWTSVTAGAFHTCGLADDGAAYCWGSNGQGQAGAGPGSRQGILRRPQPVAGGVRFRSLAGGRFHTCGLDEDGLAYCWGQGGSGQLGVDPDSASGACVGSLCISPARVPASDSLRFVELDAGAYHTCGLTEADRVWCWGDDSWGQLGAGAGGQGGGRSRPRPVEADVGFVDVAAGDRHTCAVSTSGGLWCWGENGSGQAGPLTGDTCGAAADTAGGGTGGLPCSRVPTRLETDRTFGAVAAGGSHSCALSGDGSAFCWGSDADAALGDGFGSPAECRVAPEDRGVPCSREPVAVGADVSFARLSAGGRHTCGVTASGDAWCWGYNGLGQIGYCGVGGPYAPEQVCRVTGFRRVAGGGIHSCGVTASGRAWCWGANGEGQLGTGDTRFSYFGPVEVGEAAAGG